MQISDLYADLEKFPVVVSYPDNQPSVNSNSRDLEKFKHDHDFITNYSFGKYTVEDREKEHRYNALTLDSLIFRNTYGDYNYVLIQRNRNNISPQDKPYVDLFAQIQRKAKGYDIKNPFYDRISDAIYNLQYYIRNDLPYNSMSHDDAEGLYNQLDEIRTKLVATQNIK